ncbi:MAG: amino acid dehydrogenase [Nitrospinota bacterium]|nr:MAG: amino acid dehydrogenase [Nitrospinota bacterium]
MESLLRSWDGEAVIIHFDHPTGAWIVIAIHSTRLGPAGGGTRMKTYPDLPAAVQDAMRLAAAMTYKFAIPGIAMGGGKAVIALPPDFDQRLRPTLLRHYGTLVHQLRGLFYTGPDVGTSAADMDIIAETGAPYIFGRTPAAGGAGDTGPLTAIGVFTGMQVTCAQLFGSPSLHRRRILVQGAGSVGRSLIERLCAAGAEVYFSDIDEEVVQELLKTLPVTFVAPDDVYTTECDIFAPCALGGILNRDTIPLLKCKAVVGAANNQLATPEDADRLQAREILYAPDYVVNAGAVLGIPGIETMGWSQAEAEQRVIEGIRHALQEIFHLATTEGMTTEMAARRVAEARLASSPKGDA